MSRHSSHQGDWQRVSRSRPCSICQKPDWCAFSDGIALCMRVESPRPSRGDAGGWLHPLTDEPRAERRRSLRLLAQAPVDFAALAKRFSEATTPDRLVSLAAHLGVSADALLDTGVGWCKEQGAWSWPMHDARGQVIGIRLRNARTHQKHAVGGSKQGLFLPRFFLQRPDDPRLVVVEGPTDQCAARDLGFSAVGRPSCNGGTRLLVSLTRGQHVVVVADRDEPGRRGAAALVTALLPTVLSVRTIEPPAPHKDLRAWVQAGATRSAVDAVIDAAPMQTIRVRICR